MKVERYRYAAQFHPELQPLLNELGKLLLDGRYILSDEVSRFEQEFAQYLGCRFVCGVNSGTDALILALRVLGIGPGDEVVTQANTFYATVAAIRWVGATPVLVDAEEETFLIAAEQVAGALTARTRAIIPVHLYGKPTPMKRLLQLARERGIRVVEDAAQAHGAAIEGCRVGTFGEAGCFSFHPSKNLAAAGDAGAVVTNLPWLDTGLREHRALGQRAQNEHVVLGLNSKLDSIQALILSAKLPLLSMWNERRRSLAALYREGLAGLPIGFQRADPDEEHVYHLFQMRTDCRDHLLTALNAVGIEAVVRYPTPIHLQPVFAECGWRKGQFPVAERLSEELLCLPLRPDMSESEVGYVVETTRRFFGG